MWVDRAFAVLVKGYFQPLPLARRERVRVRDRDRVRTNGDYVSFRLNAQPTPEIRRQQNKPPPTSSQWCLPQPHGKLSPRPSPPTPLRHRNQPTTSLQAMHTLHLHESPLMQSLYSSTYPSLCMTRRGNSAITNSRAVPTSIVLFSTLITAGKALTVPTTIEVDPEKTSPHGKGSSLCWLQIFIMWV